MEQKTMDKAILDFYRKPEFQKLSAYYMQSTVFNILGVQRSENRHSAFLAWLLNPNASHSLKEMPLRNFLALVAAKADDEDKCYYDQVRQQLLLGNYQLNVDCIKTEQSIVGLANDKLSDLDGIVEKTDKGQFKKDANNRFDIWMLLHITFTDDNDQEQHWCLPVVIENKIYSAEGNANDPGKAQTVRYHRAVSILKNHVCATNYCQPLLVFLTPSGAKEPAHNAFIHLTYQDVLDHVILPCTILTDLQRASEDVTVLMKGYVRNLSRPANNDGETSKDYTVLAIADTESKELQSVFESQAFQTALCAIYPKEAQTLLGEGYKAEDACPLLEQFWDSNEDLFKIVLYNQFKYDEEKLKWANNIIKVSNRDNTRYFVGLKHGDWLNANGKPASKSEASFLIFKAYCIQWERQNPGKTLTVNDLREAFKGELNSYYHDRFLNHLFYDFDEDVTVDVEGSKHFGSVVCPESDKWDFYWDDAHKLPCVEGEVRSVKMWRKNDFDRLIARLQKMDAPIVIEECL